jgi:hypothetical protein
MGKMKIKTVLHDQRGIAHIIEIVVIAVILLGVGGVIVWRVLESQKAQPNASTGQPAASVACNLADKDLCKFLTSWKSAGNFKVTTTQTANGQSTSSTMEISNEGKNFHMTMTVNGKPHETIIIGDVTYTKDHTDGKWWKQTAAKSETTPATNPKSFEFSEPADSSKPDAAKEPTYTRIGQEVCGSLQCFKYQVNNPDTRDQKQYIWFDTKDYQLRRMRLESPEFTSDQTFTLGSSAVNAPSPTKDLPANQQIVPGSDTPITVPTEADLKALY